MGDIIDLYEMIKELEERINLLENNEEEEESEEQEFNNQELEDETDPLFEENNVKL